jgi:hypothetical protein
MIFMIVKSFANRARMRRQVIIFGHFLLTHHGILKFIQDFTQEKIQYLFLFDEAPRDASNKVPCARVILHGLKVFYSTTDFESCFLYLRNANIGLSFFAFC